MKESKSVSYEQLSQLEIKDGQVVLVEGFLCSLRNVNGSIVVYEVPNSLEGELVDDNGSWNESYRIAESEYKRYTYDL